MDFALPPFPGAALGTAAWLTLGATGLAVLLLVDVLVLRLLLGRRQRLQQRIADRWRPVLLGALLGELPERIRVPRREERLFLREWNAIHESVRDEAAAGLNTLLAESGLDARCRRWLDGGVRRRLLALRTLGHFGKAEDWRAVRAQLDDPLSFVALTAARALVRIDEVRAVPLVLEQFTRRAEWPAAALYSLLEQAGPAAVSDSLRDWLRQLPADQLKRALRVAPTGYEAVVDGVVLELLRGPSDPEVLAACLRVVASPAALPRIRQLASHPAWPVRVQVANALERLGHRDDERLLIAMLHDPQWWVRLRAATALLHLPGDPTERLRRRFAMEKLHDITEQTDLRMVLAEALAMVDEPKPGDVFDLQIA